MHKNVLVTGIGGIVGQGILRNIVHLNYDISLVGTNTDLISAGNHLCRSVYQVPFSTEPNYIDVIKDISKKESIDLIIPSTDYEIFYLALAKDMLPPIACSEAEVAKIFLNKYLTWQAFNQNNIPFAVTKLPSHNWEEFSDIIVKPAEGRGSRNIFINPKNPRDFSDEYIIQKLYKGTEITTAFYITRDGEFLGQITMERTLASGATNQCSVTFDYDEKIEAIIIKILQTFNIRGAINIQSIVTLERDIIPFEINARISGTNSIRSQFGFEDVRYTIEEYLFNKKPAKPIIRRGSAIRILMDLIYPDVLLDKIKNKNVHYYLY